jgi:hypothetical protein
MAGKFEWQFKHRDEADVNAPARRPREECKKPPLCSHFCDSSDSVYPCDFRRPITIARCAHPVVTIGKEARARYRSARAPLALAKSGATMAARPCRGQIGNVGRGMPAIPRPQGNEGVGEHVRTRSHGQNGGS